VMSLGIRSQNCQAKTVTP